MFRRHLRHLGQDKGQAFVELALTLPVLILLTLGAAEIGRLAYASIEVSNAARAGVAYGAQSHFTAADNGSTGGIVQAANQDAPDVPGMTVTATNACSCESTAGVMTAAPSCAPTDINTTAGSCPSPSRIVVFVQVTTTAKVNTVFHFPGIPNTVTLQGYASMRTEQ
jgi:Flp pilus assembly protein TadG